MAIIIKRFRPMNWHYLVKCEPLNLGNTTFIAGRNYTGKSTLIDALQFLFCVSTSNFNAANAIGGRKEKRRDLTGYVRGKWRFEDSSHDEDTANFKKIYRRCGPTNTHVVAECENTETGATFVIGATAEAKSCSEGVRPNVTWWSALNCHLDDFEFTVPIPGKEDARTYGTLDNVISATPAGKLIKKYSSQKEARRRFSTKQFFYLTEDNFGDEDAFKSWVLVQLSAIAYNPKEFSNINHFISNFVLQPMPVDTEDFTNLINEQAELTQSLNELVVKTDKLKELIAVADTYRERDVRKSVLETAQIVLGIESLENKLVSESEKYDRESDRLRSMREDKRRLQSEFDETHNLLSVLEAKDHEGMAQQLKASLERDQKSLYQLEGSLDSFNKSIEAARAFAVAVNNLFGSSVISTGFLDRCPYNPEAPIENQDFLFSQLLDCLDVVGGKISEKKFNLDAERKAVNKELEDVRRVLYGLKNSVSFCLTSAQRLKDEISRVFKEHDIEDTPHFLCELLDIADSSWSEAAESYLNNDRFSIFVSPENYHLAASIAKKLRDDGSDVGAAIIDTPSFVGFETTAKDNSLAAILKSKSPLVREYINHCFGNVMLVADAENPPDKNVTCIDKDSNRYKRRSFSPMKKRTPVIGKEARRKQKEMYELRHADLSDKLINIDKELQDCKRIHDMYQNLLELRANGRRTFSDINQIRSVRKRFTDSRKRYDEFLSSPENIEMRDLSTRQESLREDLNQIQRKIEDQAGLVQRIGENQDSLRSDLVIKEDNLMKFPDFRQGAYDEIAERRKRSRKGALMMSEDMGREIDAIGGELSNLNMEIGYAQKEYNRLAFGQLEYLCNGYSSMDDYRDDFVRLATIDFVSSRDKSTQHEAKTRQYFRDHVMSKLRSNIRAASETLREINRTLRTMEFNGKIYQFADIVAADDHRKHFEMIMSPKNTEVKDSQISFDSVSFDDEFKTERDDLFHAISLCAEKPEADIPMLDYRTYCKFRLFECSADAPDKKKIDLEKALGPGSGSEVQIPCYLVLTAALVQIYSKFNRTKDMRTSNSIRLIMVDECFDKMDSGNANQMIKFTSEMGLQLIAAAPSEKFSYFGEDADSVILVYLENINTDKESRHCRQFSSYKECMPYLDASDEDNVL